MNVNPIERIYPNDKRVKPQTLRHHKARYEFACNIQTPKGIALDLASGTGYGTEMLRARGYKACGVEIDTPSIKFATKNYPLCQFFNLDITERIPYFPGTSLVTFFEAIEHFTYRQGLDILRHIYGDLASSGVLVLSTPRDANDKYNRLHKSEWSYALLKNELGSLFADVRMYGQDWDTGIIDERDVRDNDFYIAVCKK